MTTETEEQTVASYLEHAVEDLNQARQQAGEELRTAIDSAISRSREALEDLRSDAQDRTVNLRSRAEERAGEWQHTLEDATEDMRRELGVRAVHAQRSKDALDAMAEQIKEQKKHIG
ncbi:MAG: hypothetical protein WB771_04225 [Solirubrobacterales bacterium]